MMLRIVIVVVVFTTLAMVTVAMLKIEKDMDAHNQPAPAGVNGTVERRIHLSIEGKWDTDKRRRFVCREEP